LLAVSLGGLALSVPIATPFEIATAWRLVPPALGDSPALSALPGSIRMGPVTGGPPLVQVPRLASPRAKEDRPIGAGTNAGAEAGAAGHMGTEAAGSTADGPSGASVQAPARQAAAPTIVFPPISPEALPHADTWTVRPADNLWLIAKLVLSARAGKPMAPSQIAPFWAALLAANRDRFRDPSLLYAGQEVLIPR
jgi:hypothetical protein